MMRGSAKSFFAALWKDKVALVGAFVLVFVVLTATIGPIFVPLNPLAQSLIDALLPPGSVTAAGLHVFGTDELGRDVFSRLVYGAGSVLQVAILSVILAAIIGTAVGVLSGYVGGWLDRLLMQIVDIQLSVPPIVIAVLLAAAINPGVASTVIAIALMAWPQYARVLRGETARLAQSEFVNLARVAGLGRVRVLFEHILTNVSSTVIVLSTLNLSMAIIFSGGLSFIGVGIQQPTPDWGNMLAGGTQYLQSWWLVVLPGAAITATVLAFNVFGDFLRDALDPRLRGREAKDRVDNASEVGL